MELKTYYYNSDAGWSIDHFPNFDSQQTLVVAFGEPDMIDRPDPIIELVAAYPNSHIIGCSSAGEIFGVSLLEKSLVIAVVKFDYTEIKSASVPIGSAKDSFGAGQQIANSLIDPDLRAVFVLSKGLNINGSELVKGLNSELPKSVVITGGLAGDGDRFRNTWVLIGSQIKVNAVAAVGLYGDRVCVGYSYGGGWISFGVERRATRSSENVLYELDGKPALQLYKRYLGKFASDLPAMAYYFPIGLRSNELSEKVIVRTVQSISEKYQSLTFFGDIPEGCMIRLMRGDAEELTKGALDAAEKIKKQRSFTNPTLSLSVSCVGRKVIMDEQTEEELEAVMDTLPRAASQIGFYSYGELSPLTSGECALHNQTMTLTTLSED